jgi:probable rRNA maturation factor
MLAEVEIQRSGSIGVDTPADEQFQSWVVAALAGNSGDFSLAIRIADETEARHFNRDYRNRDYATNVLSFPAELPEGLPAEIRQAQLGDLLICAPVVVREAAEQSRPPMDHWAHLTIHGVLHLLGYDHERPEDALEMEALETRILAGLGVSDPYLDIA